MWAAHQDKAEFIMSKKFESKKYTRIGLENTDYYVNVYMFHKIAAIFLIYELCYRKKVSFNNTLRRSLTFQCLCERILRFESVIFNYFEPIT